MAKSGPAKSRTVSSAWNVTCSIYRRNGRAPEVRFQTVPGKGKGRDEACSPWALVLVRAGWWVNGGSLCCSLYACSCWQLSSVPSFPMTGPSAPPGSSTLHPPRCLPGRVPWDQSAGPLHGRGVQRRSTSWRVQTAATCQKPAKEEKGSGLCALHNVCPYTFPEGSCCFMCLSVEKSNPFSRICFPEFMTGIFSYWCKTC